MLSALSPARRRLVQVLIAGTLVLVAVIAVVVIRGRTEPVQPVAQDNPGPVLLVPGYGGSTTGLEVMAKALRATGRDVSIVHLPADGRGDLVTQAAALGSAVAAVLSRTGTSSVDVVGYSAGGVVARLWVRDDGGSSLARRVVTLGSPHHGTDIAGDAADFVPSQCPTACQQLAPDSDLLRALNAGDESPAGPVFVSIRSTFDTVVSVDSSELAGGTNVLLQDICPAVRTSHGELPADGLVIAIVELEIGPSLPVQPHRSQCAELSS